MSYPIDYEEINEGYVAFGGNLKGGKITGRGTIKTGKLDFKNVYFVKELKFNLFIVSQMCDKKNSVLFNDIECIVLSPDFKLTDESHVLLKVPRTNNMYSVELKNIVPKGDLTYLFAKATSDEPKLWHRRLGHLNFKTMNKLVKGNLVRGLPSKLFVNNQDCVACQKGKQHRASYHLDKFDGKADEGFFIGYSLSSKAFRVFNNRTMIVEENFHISNDGKKVDEHPRQESECKDQEKKDNVNRTNNVNDAGTNRVNVVGENSSNELSFDLELPELEDISTFTFLNKDEDDGFEDSEFPDKVYKVEKALYGLHQAPRASYETLSTYLLDNIFHRGKIDKTLFIRRHEDDILLIQVYVDDIIFGSTKKELCNAFEKMMHEKIQMKIKNESTPMETQKPLLKDVDGEEATGKAKTINGEAQLQALLDRKKLTLIGYEKLSKKLTFYKAFFSPQWKFLIHTILQCISAKTTTWNEFSITMASAIICLVTNQKFNFSNYNFESMVKNLDSMTKFLMYLRFVQVSLNNQLEGMANHNRIYVTPSHTKKIYGNIRRVGKDISGKVTPLFQTMMVQALKELCEDKAVNEEMDDSLERATTTATSLDAEQDRGGGPSCQEAIEDVVAQTRVLDLETTKTTQEMEIEILKRRVKKLNKKQRSRTHMLKRLYKVGLSARVESSNDEGLDMFGVNDLDGDEVIVKSKDVAKQTKEVVDDITLAKALMAIKSEKPKADKVNVKGKAKMIEEPMKLKKKDQIHLDKEVALKLQEELQAECEKEQRLSSERAQQEKEANISLIESYDDVQAKIDVNVKGKAKMIEEPMKLKKKDQIHLDKEVALKLQEELQAECEKEQRLSSERAQQEKEANIALIESYDDVQAKIDVDYELAQRLQVKEQDELTDVEKAKLFMQFLEKRRKFFAAKKAKEKKNRPPTKAQQRNIMSTYLKNMDGWKHKSLKIKSVAEIQELFDKAMKKVNTFVDFRTKLVKESSNKAKAEITLEGSSKRAADELEQKRSKKQKVEDDKESKELKKCLENILEDRDDIMFEHYVEDNVWKNQQGLVKVKSWKIYDSCGVHYPYKLGSTVTKIKNLENDTVDETLEIDEIVNIKESRNHPLENIIGNLNQRTLRSQAQNQSNFFCFISTIEPKNVNEALGDESWIVAMQEELNQFIANGVWELVPQPRNMKITGTKWLFRNKLDENGIVYQNKARLVAQGYNQQEDIDYDETYASVARLEYIRILLAYACALDFKLFQMDVKSAFLNGFINKEVYVAQPPGFIDFKKPNHVYKLKKALYSLKQEPKAWYDKLKAFLVKHEYKMGMIDKTLFTKKKGLNLIMVQIYVDDIIFGLTCQDMCDEFAKIMHDEFKMSMMVDLNFFLGLQIKQIEDGEMTLEEELRYTKSYVPKISNEKYLPKLKPFIQNLECRPIHEGIPLKQAMMSTPVLALPNFEKEFIVETDTSSTGIGAVNPNIPSKFNWKANQLTRRGKLVMGDVPELKDYLLTYVHATSIGGHSGVNVTLQNLKAMVYCKGMRKWVKNKVKSYDVCKRNKPDLSAYLGYLQPLPIPPTIRSSISMDFIEGLPSS
nr:retrovirus-related Pol polyprotein from transposon TNT 1-94 [Tanacetum cinerariifolium]